MFAGVRKYQDALMKLMNKSPKDEVSLETKILAASIGGFLYAHAATTAKECEPWKPLATVARSTRAAPSRPTQALEDGRPRRVRPGNGAAQSSLSIDVRFGL